MLWKIDSPADLLYRHAVLGGAVAGPVAVGAFQAGGKVEDDGEDGIAGEGGQVVETAPEIVQDLLRAALPESVQPGRGGLVQPPLLFGDREPSPVASGAGALRSQAASSRRTGMRPLRRISSTCRR